MDINHISLTPAIIAGFYPSSLVNPEETQATGSGEAATPTSINESEKTWKWLGENKKKILVVVKYQDAVHIPDQELQFLTTMLTACQLSLADVAIINLLNQPHQHYKEILEQFQSRVALLFDTDPASFGLPMNFPHFQIQPFSNCSFLYAPALEVLEKDKVQKSKLWVALRRLFNI
jgi:hypothetical protein